MADIKAGKNILGLKLPTDPRWVNIAALSMEEILSDHAYCEQKAATQCISLIQKYPEHSKLVSSLAPIVTEEWGHFRLVLAELKKRHLTLGHQRKDEYVNQLMSTLPRGISKEQQLLQKLLVCALIEARSCERFRVLSENLTEDNLKDFYRKFMISEAGHYRLFLDLAYHYFDKATVDKHWHNWLITEKKVVEQLPLRGDRMH